METGFTEHYASLFQNVVMLVVAILSASAILMFLRFPKDLRRAVQRHNGQQIFAIRARYRLVERQGVLLALPVFATAMEASSNLSDSVNPMRTNGAVQLAVVTETTTRCTPGVEEFNRAMHALRS